MKKIILLLSLLVVSMFLMGCSEELSDTELDLIEEDVSTDKELDVTSPDSNLDESKVSKCVEMEAQVEPNPFKTIDCFADAGVPKEEICGYFKNHYSLFLFCYNDHFKIEPIYSYELCAGYPDGDDSQSSAQRSCFAHLGVQEENITLCPEPTEVFAYHHHCYTGIAEAKKDESICKFINKSKMDYSGQMECYKKVAILKDDSSICLNIVGSNLKNDCLTAVSKNS
jgi:hypothetical protein